MPERETPTIITARTAGFCFGVERAVSCVYRLAQESTGPIYTFGPIINNEEVVADLRRLGVQVTEDPELLRQLVREGRRPTVVIRSHGVGRATEELLRRTGAVVEDATCPFVKKIHRIAAQAASEGRTVGIIGDENHPEVIGIRGWCGKKSLVIGDLHDEKLHDLPEKLTIVSQTTYNREKFEEIVESIDRKCYDSHTVNTICNATQERQTEARQIAANVDAMIVVGSKNSSNTQKLYDICRAQCPRTYYIQTVKDLETEKIPNVRSLGITAGASTPNKIIEEVQTYVRRKL